MRISVRMFVVSALAVAGCASAGVANHDRDPILVMLGNGTTIRYNRDIHVVTENLADSPATLWPRLKAAIAAMGLRVTVVDSASYLIGVQNAELNGRFEGAPVARVLDCGLTPMGSSGANAYRVWLTVGSQLLARPDWFHTAYHGVCHGPGPIVVDECVAVRQHRGPRVGAGQAPRRW